MRKRISDAELRKGLEELWTGLRKCSKKENPWKGMTTREILREIRR